MSTLRRRFKQGFTTVPNTTAQDNRLSLKARGLLAYLLAHPDDWQVRSRQIANDVPDGREAVQRALRELGHYRYYRIVNEHQADGTFKNITDVSDSPVDEAGWGHQLDPDPAKWEKKTVCEQCRVEAGLPKRVRLRTVDPRPGIQAMDPRPGNPDPGVPEPGSPGPITNTVTQDEDVLEHTDRSVETEPLPRARPAAVDNDRPPSRFSGPIHDLADALSDAGLNLRWDLDDDQARTVAARVTAYGVPTLVTLACELDAQHKGPALSARAFRRLWERIPPPCGDCDPTGRQLLGKDGTPTARCVACHPAFRRSEEIQTA